MIRKKKILISLIISILGIINLNSVYASTISEDINSIDDNKYPGIKSSILRLQSEHPSWKFKVEYTGLDFNEVVVNECQGHGKSPRNLSPANNSNYSGMWICPICKTKTFDSNNWYCASEEAIKYMVDPRNSINVSDIFQFLDLSDTSNISTTVVTETANCEAKIEGTSVFIVPGVDYNKIKSLYNNSIVKDSSDVEITTGVLATGNKLIYNNQTFTIIKKGDVNFDGNVNIVDVVNILNSITGKKELTAEGKLAAKVTSGNGEISIVDVVNILNYITGKKEITMSETVTNVTQDLNSCVKNFASTISYLDDECVNAIMTASNQFKINPLYLIARIYQEQGKNGSVLISGEGYNGTLQGYYNFFNINATGNGKEAIIKNGLSYAQNQGWNSKTASIVGGAKIISEKYINNKQNTLYYQKFNVVGKSLYNHQYMQNILAAQSEGTSLRKTYQSMDANLSNGYTFTIPVYENMPKTTSPRPNTSQNNEIAYTEKTISVSSSVFVRSAPTIKSSKVSSLSNGQVVKVLSTTENKIDNYYWSLIVCEATGDYGYVACDYIK